MLKMNQHVNAVVANTVEAVPGKTASTVKRCLYEEIDLYSAVFRDGHIVVYGFIYDFGSRKSGEQQY